MNCLLCNSELTQPDSIQYRICLECRLFPGQASKPQTDDQHDQAVARFRRLIKSTIVQKGDTQ